LHVQGQGFFVDAVSFISHCGQQARDIGAVGKRSYITVGLSERMLPHFATKLNITDLLKRWRQRGPFLTVDAQGTDCTSPVIRWTRWDQYVRDRQKLLHSSTPLATTMLAARGTDTSLHHAPPVSIAPRPAT